MPALPDLASPTAIDTRPAAARDWEICADYYEGPIGGLPDRVLTQGILQSDERITRLISEDYSEPEILMGSLQKDLRRGDRKLASLLMKTVRDGSLDNTVRALALETLAGARVRTLEPEVLDIILDAIERKNSDLQFAAVAAASDLSRHSQVRLAGAIRGLVRLGKADYWVLRAAKAFLASL